MQIFQSGGEFRFLVRAKLRTLPVNQRIDRLDGRGQRLESIVLKVVNDLVLSLFTFLGYLSGFL